MRLHRELILHPLRDFQNRLLPAHIRQPTLSGELWGFPGLASGARLGYICAENADFSTWNCVGRA